jgi:hypothetical protein
VAAADKGGLSAVSRWQLRQVYLYHWFREQVDAWSVSHDYELGCLRACRAERPGSMLALRPHRRIDS